ncbi:ribonuclease III [Choiromyces venosus 120613-1]|uniref:ribonuclease III n=1 Tax=Choiromyces venosus 120613-1 TaxID=1336337 RepID=A0A3N4JP54_9PEZI|nr:ribonuclease III [Choiromyces venosus 120613-1]
MVRSRKRKHDDTDAITVSSPSRKESKRSKGCPDYLTWGTPTTKVLPQNEKKKQEQRRKADEPGRAQSSTSSSDVSSAHKPPFPDISQNFDAFGSALAELILAAPKVNMEKCLGDEKANFFTAVQTMFETGDLPWLDEYMEKAKEARWNSEKPKEILPANRNNPTAPLKNEVPKASNSYASASNSSSSPSAADTTLSTSLSSSSWPPPLPDIHSDELRQQAFTHKSFIKGEDAGLPGIEQQHYERLEFLGDSYLQSITSRILYNRFPKLREGPLSDMRQQLVANRPLSTYATIYRFHDKVRESKGQNTAVPVALVHNSRGTLKDMGVNKTLADCFEAYIAAIVLDSPNGVDVAQRWLTELFEPKLKEMETQHASVGPIDKMAKQTLNTIVGGNRATVEYIWTDGKGGNKGGYWITVYLTGWGFNKREIGSGWGNNKGEATLRAAMNCISNQEFCKEMTAIKSKYLAPKPHPLPASNAQSTRQVSPEYIPPE